MLRSTLGETRRDWMMVGVSVRTMRSVPRHPPWKSTLSSGPASPFAERRRRSSRPSMVMTRAWRMHARSMQIWSTPGSIASSRPPGGGLPYGYFTHSPATLPKTASRRPSHSLVQRLWPLPPWPLQPRPASTWTLSLGVREAEGGEFGAPASPSSRSCSSPSSNPSSSSLHCILRSASIPEQRLVIKLGVFCVCTAALSSSSRTACLSLGTDQSSPSRARRAALFTPPSPTCLLLVSRPLGLWLN
mmetsp:Transcript_24422/g.48911  ORF Transcript_24422/g.48911 Transcript_24422/m.48911 type:complete len:245 (+) Transcript_24422:279-1013(+)